MNLRKSILLFAIVILCCLSCIPTEPEDDSGTDPVFDFVDIQFADEQRGLLVAGRGVYRTIDGGRTWERSRGAPTFLKGAGYADLNTAIVVGNNWTVLRTADGGQTWTSPIDKDDLDKALDVMLNVYQQKTGLNESELKNMIGGKDLILNASEALKLGFVDEVFETEAVMTNLYQNVMDGEIIENHLKNKIENTKRRLEEHYNNFFEN